jgi:uncharacterized protein YbjQ (UPF0145 family)
MNELVERGLAAIDRGDPKEGWKAFERFDERVLRRGDATDADTLAVLGAFDDLIALAPNDARFARYENWLVPGVRQRVADNPAAYPCAAAAEIARRQAAAGRVREQGELAKAERVASTKADVARGLPMTTTPNLPGREIDEALTVVSGSCVMSRNALSDFGSDFKSSFGGTLGGIERAVESARQLAMERLERAAKDVGADAVVGIDMTVQTVSDKAQLVMLLGTAVLLRA